MTALGALAREFVLGGHMLALGTASIAAAVAIAMGEPFAPLLLVMAYLFSYGAYMMNRSTEIMEDAASNPQRTSHLASRRGYLPYISGGCFLAGYALALTVNLIFFVALLVPLVLSGLYSVGSKRLMGGLGVTKLKEKLLVKNLVISLGWALIPGLVGLYYFSGSGVLLFLSIFIFLRLTVNTLTFDVRDAEGDKANGIRTVPAVFGSSVTFRAMAVVDVATVGYVLAGVAFQVVPAFGAALALLPLYSLVYEAMARRPGANLGFICDVVADGEYLLWGPLMLLGRVIF